MNTATEVPAWLPPEIHHSPLDSLPHYGTYLDGARVLVLWRAHLAHEGHGGAPARVHPGAGGVDLGRVWKMIENNGGNYIKTLHS